MTLHITTRDIKVWYVGIDLGPPHGDCFEIMRKGEDEDSGLGWLFEHGNDVVKIESGSEEEQEKKPPKTAEEQVQELNALFRTIDPGIDEYNNPLQTDNQYRHEPVASRIEFFERGARSGTTSEARPHSWSIFANAKMLENRYHKT